MEYEEIDLWGKEEKLQPRSESKNDENQSTNIGLDSLDKPT